MMIDEIMEQIQNIFGGFRGGGEISMDKAYQATLNNLNQRGMSRSTPGLDKFADLYSIELNLRVDKSWALIKAYFDKHDFLFDSLNLERIKDEINVCIQTEVLGLIRHSENSLHFRHDLDFRNNIARALKRTQLDLNSKINGELSLYKKHNSGDTELSISMNNAKKDQYVDKLRIEELRTISFQLFDLSKLIRLCEELNIAYENECFLSISMLLRTILNHIPPIFQCSNFSEVANNSGEAKNKSFKKSMKNLENSLKNIADIHLHKQIDKKAALPTFNQVNFIPDLDLLLSEIIVRLG